MRIPTLIIALLVLSANAFADDQTDQAAYCQYVTEQAVAAVDLLRTPAIVSGVTQPNTGLPAQAVLGFATSVSGFEKARLTMLLARKNCELYAATTTAQQQIANAPAIIEKAALQHRVGLVDQALGELDLLIAATLKLVDAQNQTRPMLYSLQAIRTKLLADREDTRLKISNLYTPSLNATPLRELIAKKQQAEVEDQKAQARLTRQNNWDFTIEAGARQQISPFVGTRLGPYAILTLSDNLGSRAINRHLERAVSAYAYWKTVQEGDVIRNAEILKQQIGEGIAVERETLSGLLHEDGEFEQPLALLAGIDTTLGVQFKNQLIADRLVLDVDVKDHSFRLERLQEYLRDNF
jgi:hypothetical protein